MRRLVRSLRNRGVLGTVRHAVARLLPGHARRRERRAEERARTRDEATRAFDEAGGVETGGLIRVADLGLDGRHRTNAAAYEPILPHEFHAMMRAAGPVAEGRTFVDLGCGKGRALLLAAMHPFARVVGVELAAGLAERARENVAAYRGSPLACRDVDVVHGDAADFDFPEGPLVLFLFYPFDGAVTEKVVENLVRAMDREARPVTVVYAHARHDGLFARVPRPMRIARGRPTVDGDAGYDTWSIFHFDPVAGAASCAR